MGVSIGTGNSAIEFNAEVEDLEYYIAADDNGDDTLLNEAELSTFIFNAYFNAATDEIIAAIEDISADDTLDVIEKSQNINDAINTIKAETIAEADAIAESVLEDIGEGPEVALMTVWDQIEADGELSNNAKETAYAHNAITGKEAASKRYSSEVPEEYQDENGNAIEGTGAAVEDAFYLQYQGGENAQGDMIHYGDLSDQNDYSVIENNSFTEENGILSFSTEAKDPDAGGHGNRSELREKEQWDITDGTHSMAARYQNLEGDQTIMQVHMEKDMMEEQGVDKKPPVRVAYEDGNLVAYVYENPGDEDPQKVEIATNVDPVGGFDLETRVVDGEVQFFYSEEPGGITADSQPTETLNAAGWNDLGNAAHFKLGSYNDKKDSNSGTSVEVSAWGVDHSGGGNFLSTGEED